MSDDLMRNVYLAKMAEQSERYDEMVEYMKTFAKKTVAKGEDLSFEERNLLSVAYKNVVGARRASMRIIDSVEAKEVEKGALQRGNAVRSYKQRVLSELNRVCEDILDLLDRFLITSATSAEASVFYLKMKADYYRYLAEFETGSIKAEYGRKANKAYDSATGKATELAPTHPIRLGLALNYSVFLYEVLATPQEACKLAKQAFDDAIAELDTLDEESYKDSTLIMQLLRDNLTLWSGGESEQ